MIFERPSPGVKIIFENEREVRTVHAAYVEYATRMISLGNDGSVSAHEKDVINKWEDRPTSYFRGGSHRSVAEKLFDFHEATEERVDEILDERDNPDRVFDAAKRYEFGSLALELAESIELQASMDVELENLL
jgi:hypothetical protein